MASRAFLILHGYGNRRPPEHWTHWLARGLRDAGADVIYPQLPEPDEPVLSEWLDALGRHLTELSELGQAGTRERIVICHSLSCLLWLHGAERGWPAALIPNRLVLVSPPGNAWIPDPAADDFAVAALDPDALRASAGEVRIVCSDADPYNPPGTPATFAQPQGVPYDLIPGAGHISTDDGYGPWPALRVWCDTPDRPVGG